MVEEAEEEGRWEGRDRMTTKGRLMGRGEDDYDNLTPTHLDYEAAVASSNSNLAMLFTLGGERGCGNCNRIHQACVRCFNTGLSTRLYLLVLVMTNREARILRGGGGVNPQKKSRSTKGGGGEFNQQLFVWADDPSWDSGRMGGATRRGTGVGMETLKSINRGDIRYVAIGGHH